MGTGLIAWVGVDGSPQEKQTLLQSIVQATENTETARFLATSSQQTLGSSGYPAAVPQIFTVSTTGSVDFGADEVARRSTVIQAGLPKQTYQSYFAPSVLYERVGHFHFGFGGWTKYPSVIDPIVAIPGLGVLRLQASESLRRMRTEVMDGEATTEYRLVPNLEAVCAVPGQSTQRLLTRTTIWVDSQDLLRHVNQVEESWITERRPGFSLHLLTRDSVTLSGFGEAMVFGIPSHARSFPGANSPTPSSSSAPKASCRRLGGHGAVAAGSGQWIAVGG